ncbi:MAG TPA: GAP family protein [Candidatus Gracilibacteria bacterium]|nr:GAP family protein [Candidatus Gracilibacteria bacterium]
METVLQDVRLPTVIVTALVDSINPCAIGVLILLVSTLSALHENKNRMLFVGFIYIAAVYVTYFLAGIGLLTVIQKLNLAQFVGLLVGGFVILLGLIEMKGYFFESRAFMLQINPKHAKRIKEMVKKTSVPGVIVLGIFVAAVELPCTGGPYLAITAMLSKRFDLMAIYYLLIYNFIFVLPLIVIVGLAYAGTSIESLKKWKDKNKKFMRLATGLLMVGLGVLLILFALDIIKLV